MKKKNPNQIGSLCPPSPDSLLIFSHEHKKHNESEPYSYNRRDSNTV